MGSCTPATMPVPDRAHVIRIPLFVWAELIPELRRRGAGRRESGVFLLGRGDTLKPRVTTCLYYDDLDPRALDSGAVNFHSEGYAKLWEYCRAHCLEVLADIHTHPGRDVRQSSIDERHPMVPRKGHTAMIVPNLGRTSRWSLAFIGVYEYLGNFKWRTHAPGAKSRRVRLSLW